MTSINNAFNIFDISLMSGSNILWLNKQVIYAAIYIAIVIIAIYIRTYLCMHSF